MPAQRVEGFHVSDDHVRRLQNLTRFVKEPIGVPLGQDQVTSGKQGQLGVAHAGPV